MQVVGKSMLIDLFADCLPTSKKKRSHFTAFMLDIFSRLEHLRRSRQSAAPTSSEPQDEYSLVLLARDMISTSPILFLDEFQLPDRATSKIMTNFLTCFFRLGGVLIASSNRMPEELSKAAGKEFVATPPPPTRFDSLRWKLNLGSRYTNGRSEAISRHDGEFAGFLEVLRARCDVWQMEGEKDYRRRETELSDTDSHADDHQPKDLVPDLDESGRRTMETLVSPLNLSSRKTYGQASHLKSTRSYVPMNFFINEIEDPDGLILHQSMIQEAESKAFYTPPARPIPWTSSSIRIYGRHVRIPKQYEGVCKFTFNELCASSMGPADYMSLASMYHTFILTGVPVLTTFMKNEARRFITFLDSIYEARCKLLVDAAAGPDDLFFPSSAKARTSEQTIDQDALLAETLSEYYQDATAPFRPNISSYSDNSTVSSPEELNYAYTRLADTEPNGQRGKGPLKRVSKLTNSYSNGLLSLDNVARSTSKNLRTNLTIYSDGPNFQDSRGFTGEDEKFAYKRARSRLWEMCGKKWWDRNDADYSWWSPLHKDARHWEFDASQLEQEAKTLLQGEINPSGNGGQTNEGSVGFRKVNTIQDDIINELEHNTSPFRRSLEPPPKFSFTHVWGLMKWGKRAGPWGQGVDGLGERNKKEERGELRRMSNSKLRKAREKPDE